MTTPDLSSIIPSKAKAWVGLLGSVLSFVVPLVLSVQDYLPAPWPAVIGGALAVLTALGIYRAPYKPEGTVLAPAPTASPEWAGQVEAKPLGNGGNGTYANPWQ